jgi:hypothetical protein
VKILCKFCAKGSPCSRIQSHAWGSGLASFFFFSPLDDPTHCIVVESDASCDLALRIPMLEMSLGDFLELSDDKPLRETRFSVVWSCAVFSTIGSRSKT